MMSNAISALINDSRVKGAGQLLVHILIAAFLTYVVLQLRELNQFKTERERMIVIDAESLRATESRDAVLDKRLAELEVLVWGEIQPKVIEQEKVRVVRIPVWQNREKEILSRLSALEQWRLRHMNTEH